MMMWKGYMEVVREAVRGGGLKGLGVNDMRSVVIYVDVGFLISEMIVSEETWFLVVGLASKRSARS